MRRRGHLPELDPAGVLAARPPPSRLYQAGGRPVTDRECPGHSTFARLSPRWGNFSSIEETIAAQPLPRLIERRAGHRGSQAGPGLVRCLAGYGSWFPAPAGTAASSRQTASSATG
jgi:hypothetical protein